MTMHLQVMGTRMRDLHEAVPLLEGLAAGMAAQRVRDGISTPDALDALVKAGRCDLHSTADPESFVHTAAEFHRSILHFVGNNVVGVLTEATGHVFASRTRRAAGSLFDDAERRRVESEHRQITDAIRRGNVAKARQLMEQHMVREAEHLARAYAGALDDVVDWR